MAPQGFVSEFVVTPVWQTQGKMLTLAPVFLSQEGLKQVSGEKAKPI